MKLQDILINNFMPFRGEQFVEFPQNEMQNVMLLFGDNMRGKTSFLNAIRWGIFGKAVGRHLRVIPRVNLVNVDSVKSGDWSMFIVLKFTHDTKLYELRRHLQKKVHISNPTCDADFEEVIGLKVDNQVLPGDAITNVINEIIPEDISRFFLFDGELLQEYENLLVDESDQGQEIKNHIEQALGVPALTHARDELVVLLKEARRIQAKDARNDDNLKNFCIQQQQLESKQVSFENDLDELSTQKSIIQNQIDSIDDELKNTEVIQQKKVQLGRLHGERDEIERTITDLATEKRELLRTAWKDVLHISVAPIVVRLKEERDTLQSAMTNKAILADNMNKLLKILEEPTCTTCHQKVPEGDLKAIRDEYELLHVEDELTVVDLDSIGELNSKIDKLSQIRSSGEGLRIIEIINKDRRQQILLIKVETTLDEVENEIRGFDTDHIMRQREKRDRLSNQLSRVTHDSDKCQRDIEENEREQDHIATLISRSVGSEGMQSSIRVKIYQDLELVFSKGIESLRDSLRETVEEYASQAFSELTTEKGFSGLEINKNYGLSIIDHEKRVLKERSAGAEQIVALSLIDGLNRTARKSGPIIMDTPLGRLDPKHRQNVLAYLPKMAEQVVLLVHEGEIDQNSDLDNLAQRIGARYQIEHISATQSRITKSINNG